MRLRLANVLSLAVVGWVGLSGCDKLLAKTDAVSIVTRTPSLDDALGMDEFFDVLPSEARQDVTTVLVGVGERESTTSTEVTPLAGAAVKVEFNGTRVSLCAAPEGEGDGTYQANSIPNEETCGDEALTYIEDAEYTTTIETSSDVFTMKVTAPPPVVQSLVAFSPDIYAGDATLLPNGGELYTHDGSALTVDWHEDTAAADRNTFVVVARVRFTNAMGNDDVFDAGNWAFDKDQDTVFDTFPREASAMIDLITKEPETSVTIPSSAFDSAGLYALAVIPAELSQETEGLGVASGALAGQGTVWVFWVD